jgi:hypothetical protein
VCVFVCVYICVCIFVCVFCGRSAQHLYIHSTAAVVNYSEQKGDNSDANSEPDDEIMSGPTLLPSLPLSNTVHG